MGRQTNTEGGVTASDGETWRGKESRREGPDRKKDR